MKYVLKVAYDGAAFFGFQRQSQHKTVQGELEEMLGRFFSDSIQLVAAGRTDAGVHGTGQVVSFEHPREQDLGRLCHSLNAMARSPVAVLEAALLDNSEFHPRYSACSRTYSYSLLDQCTPSEALLWKGRAWCLSGRLEPDLVCRAASTFLGEHDFTTFSFKAAELPSRVRVLHSLELHSESTPGLLSPCGEARLWRLQVTGSGFLRRMVRLLTAGLVEVGLGLRTESDLRARFEAQDAALAPHPAPPAGLYLQHIGYDPDPFVVGGDTLRHHRAVYDARLRVKQTRIP